MLKNIADDLRSCLPQEAVLCSEQLALQKVSMLNQIHFFLCHSGNLVSLTPHFVVLLVVNSALSNFLPNVSVISPFLLRL